MEENFMANQQKDTGMGQTNKQQTQTTQQPDLNKSQGQQQQGGRTQTSKADVGSQNTQSDRSSSGSSQNKDM